MKVIIDAEFNGLNPTKIWCIVCKEVKTGEVREFSGRALVKDFLLYIRGVTCFIGHHVIGYDIPNINRLVDGSNIDWRRCIDTLVVSRLVDFNRLGGHSVENWARRWPKLQQKVVVGSDEWDDPTKVPLYLERCKADVEIQYRIYKELEKYIDSPIWRRAMRVEHDMAYICHDMHQNGFSFNRPEAERLLSQITTEMQELEEEIRASVPPVLVQDQPYTLKRKKDGKPDKGTTELLDVHGGVPVNFVDGEVLHRFHYEPFNPGSAKQRIELLNKSGWKPVEKTKGHNKCERELRIAKRRGSDTRALEERLEHFRIYGWKCDETNLGTLPHDAPRGAHSLAVWLTLEGRRGDLVEWLASYSPSTGRIHGGFNGIGAWTHRMSHVRPNQGNIFSTFDAKQIRGTEPTPVELVKLRYNNVLRALWKSEAGAYLLGVDAEGIQGRVFGHYVDDAAYTKAIEEGNKELGTDLHSFNRSLLGHICRTRDDAKTFFYAWLLGAGLEKIMQILGCTYGEAQTAVGKFVSGVPGIEKLKRVVIPRDARRGHFIGLDGRPVINRSQHLMLAGYLQNGEACVMKHANVLWRKEADAAGIRYRQVDFVHDEWQTEVYDMASAKFLGALQCRAITQIGRELGMKVKLAGEMKIGRNWLETH